MDYRNEKGRRQFIKRSAWGVIGLGLAGRPAGAGRTEAPEDPPRIKDYRTLGRTGFKVSDISCGFIMDDGVIRAAREAGMNYFDTAEEYPGHHRVLAKALKGLDRKSYFLTTKLLVEDDKTKE